MVALLASDDLLGEHSYLVAHGLRPIGLGGHLHVEAPDDLMRVATKVEWACCEGSIPFVIEHGDGTASYGYAGNR
jgi:hypothetical protein